MATEYAAAQINNLHNRFFRKQTNEIGHAVDECAFTIAMAQHLSEHALELFESEQVGYIQDLAKQTLPKEYLELLRTDPTSKHFTEEVEEAKLAGIEAAKELIHEELKVLDDAHPKKIEHLLRAENSDRAYSPTNEDRLTTILHSFEDPRNSFAGELRRQRSFRQRIVTDAARERATTRN